MENQKSCKIAASRRRGNLFKKAAELATLCGARIAVVAISKKGKVWLFPGSEVVIDIYDEYKELSLPDTRLIISRKTESTESAEEAAVMERKKQSRSDLESSLPDTRLILSRKQKSRESEEGAAVMERMKESRSDLELSLPDTRLIVSRKRKSAESEEDAAVMERMKEFRNLAAAEESLNQSWLDLTLSLGMPSNGIN